MRLNTALKIKLYNNRTIHRFFFLVFLCICLFSSCSDRSNENNKFIETDNDTLIPPVSTIVTNPIFPCPNSCPKPTTLSFPKSGKIEKVIQSKNGSKTITLTSPEKKSADFFVPMQNYNTEQGLILSAILCGYCDKQGNLWFGTMGGGVSRFDGKYFTNFTADKGLAGNRVECITEDRMGNIWFATSGGGVSRYDGKTFTNLTTEQGLANDMVRSVFEDKKGMLWFGTTGGGVSRYLPSISGTGNGIFKNFTSLDGLSSNEINCIMQDKSGNLWFGTDGGGVSVYDPTSTNKSFKSFSSADGLTNNLIRCITEDKTGTIWLGTAGGVFRYTPSTSGKNVKGSFINFTTANGLANNSISCITEDRTGNIWFGTKGGGVSCYDPSAALKTGSHIFQNLTVAQGLPNNFVMSITKDKMGYLWFGTMGGGVSRYEGNSFSNFSTVQGLSNVWSINEDESGNLWFGTNENGISRFTPSRTAKGGFGFFTNYNTMQGLPENNVYAVFKDKSENLWIGTNGGGLSHFEAKADTTGQAGFTNYSTEQGLANNIVRAIGADRRGNIWFGTNGGGLSRFTPLNPVVSGLKTTPELKPGFTNFTTEQGLANNFIRCITEDKNGNLWFGTYGGGVTRFIPNLSKNSKNGEGVFTNYTTAQGLAHKIVRCITQDRKGNMWFGTDGGISVMLASKINEKIISKENNLFKNFTVKEGLSNDIVTQIEEDKDGNMILGTNDGFTVLKAGIHAFEIYNNKTGYPVKDINAGQGGMFLDSKGVLWAAMGDKIIRFNYSGVNKNRTIPTVFIQSIKVEEENVIWNQLNSTFSKKNYKENNTNPQKIKEASVLEENFYFGRELNKAELRVMRERFSDINFDSITRFYPLPVNLVLPYKHNSITFDFGAIEPARPGLVRYQYKLEGYDKEWGPITNKTSATFGNINEGSYTLKLRARSPNGLWSEAITYKFKVLPPWWRTWWMYLIYVASLLLCIWIFFRLSEQSLYREKDLLEEKVALRTEQLKKQKEIVELKNREITENMLELEKLSIVASKTNNGVMICDKTGAMEYINEGMEHMLGYTLEEIKEKFGAYVQGFSHNPEIDKSIQEAIAGKTPITYEAINTTKAGKNVWIATTLTPIENSKGELHKIVIIDVDVTENKRKSIEIQQSINYARRIQNAILPDLERITASLPNSFILYKPKDVVSGDFYWFKIWNESIVIATVDCTGHGVPGALMSVIGSNLLNQISTISPFNKPGWVLENLHEQVRATLQQDAQGSELTDGMDIIMCKINFEHGELEYAGANRPLYHVSNNVLTKVRADSYSVGGYQTERRRKFSSHKIKLVKGDTFYLCTDGYADQFGGKNKKKFMNKRFQNLLLEIQDKTMEEQKTILSDRIEAWKGFEEQVDDILIIGIKI